MSEQPSTSPKRRRESTLPGLVIACIVAFIWSFIQAARHEPDAAVRDANLSFKLGYLLGGVLGQSAVIALIIWLVLYFAYVRKRDADRGGRHFLTLFCSAVGGGLAFTALVATAVLTGEDERQAIGTTFEEYGQAVVALDNDLAADVAAVTGVGGVMDTLDGREDLPEARQRLEALLPRIDEGEAAVEALQAETAQRLETAGASRSDIAEFQEGQAEANALRVRAITLMRSIVEANLEQVAVLENAGTWRLTADDRFEFDRTSDARSYNATGMRLLELAAESQVLQGEINAHLAAAPEASPRRP